MAQQGHGPERSLSLPELEGRNAKAAGTPWPARGKQGRWRAFFRGRTCPSDRPTLSIVEQAPLAAFLVHGWRWLLGRFQGKAPRGARETMRLVAHLALGGRRSLVLVEVEGQRYLIGGSMDTVTAIVPLAANTAPPNELDEKDEKSIAAAREGRPGAVRPVFGTQGPTARPRECA